MTTFVLHFSPTPRGARPARRLASHQMDVRGRPHGSPIHDTVELIVAEPAANSVSHGRAPGRDAELRGTIRPRQDRLGSRGQWCDGTEFPTAHN
ncbi:hypothetical protein [Streptomyces sp. NPDC005784]|uniref:hypothetical protein n=1 Tax=Streptomyces sp. NPDC005784 TaxID=3364731 RepID=UPI003691BFE3